MKREQPQAPWQSLPEPQLREWQMRKFRTYLRDVVLPFSAHYRDLFAQNGLHADDFQTVEDLAFLPFTGKADLLDTPEHPQKAREFVLIPDQHILAHRPGTVWQALLHGREEVKQHFESEYRPIFMTSTTGRAADPVPFLYTQHDIANLASAGRRVFEVCGAERDMRLLNMFPYAPHLAFWLTHYGAQAFGVFLVGSGGGKVMGTHGNLRLIRKIKPDVLIGMPTFVYHVLHAAVEDGVRCENLRRIVLGGEKVPAGMRRKLHLLAAQLGVKRLDISATYGFTEAKLAWAECPCTEDVTPGGFHLLPDLGIVEIVDPQSGRPVADGQPGEIVFTPLDSRGSVVLRYRTGDVIDGGLVFEPCPLCGRRVPRLVGNISRRSEIRQLQLDKLKGTLVDFNQLEHVLDDIPQIGAWQLELRKQHDDPLDLDELILHVNQTDSLDEGRLIRLINHRFLEQTELQPNRIEFHSAEDMRHLQGVGTELKEQKLVDHRPKNSSSNGVPNNVSSNQKVGVAS